MIFNQQDFDVRCEWGEHGIATLAPSSDVLIIVDVLSFSTSVDVAVARGATVFPYRWRDESAQKYAESKDAILVSRRRELGKYSLSPSSLINIPAGTRIVLPSPNGSALSLAANRKPVLTGCIRNARAVAIAARELGSKIAVIPAGERWESDGSLRPSLEDLIGAGAIISHLEGKQSPEAKAALAAFRDAKSNLEQVLYQCGSGKELIERGYTCDVSLAGQLNVSTWAPVLVNGAYTRVQG